MGSRSIVLNVLHAQLDSHVYCLCHILYHIKQQHSYTSLYNDKEIVQSMIIKIT